MIRYFKKTPPVKYRFYISPFGMLETVLFTRPITGGLSKRQEVFCRIASAFLFYFSMSFIILIFFRLKHVIEQDLAVNRKLLSIEKKRVPWLT